MITKLFLKGRLHQALREDEKQRLEAAISDIRIVPPRTTLVERAELIDRSYYLVEGTMLRCLDGEQGERQILEIQVPGDFVDLHGFPMKRLDHEVVTLTECRLAVFEHKAIEALLRDLPHLTRLLWFSTMLDAAMHREWIFRLGRLNAEGRVAHLLCELIQRLRFIGQYDGRTFPIPLLQRDFAEACGTTTVHMNRVFKRLRTEGLISSQPNGSGLFIENEDGLRTIGEFSPDYLYGEGELDASKELRSY